MRNLKIFPKLFVQTFAILGILIIVVHLIVFLMFPKVYLENRKSKIMKFLQLCRERMNSLLSSI